MSYKFTLYAHGVPEYEPETGSGIIDSKEVTVDHRHQLSDEKEKFRKEVKAKIGFPVKVEADSQYSVVV